MSLSSMQWPAGVGGLLVLVLAGCAAHPAARSAMAGAAAPVTGTIVAARHAPGRNRAGARDGVLDALGASAEANTTSVTEFIVREESGAVVSVMQPDPTTLHPGERVRILRAGVTRLRPLDTGA